MNHQASISKSLTFRLGVDTGGTFTDIVLIGDAGDIYSTKALTDHDDPVASILAGLSALEGSTGLAGTEVLRNTELIVYGTTRATNAVVEGKLSRVAFFTTEGFPDILYLREGGKPGDVENVDYPPPPVSRADIYEVPERINAEGEIVRAIDTDTVDRQLEKVGRSGAEAIAVCLLWSVVNPVHERLIRARAASLLPDMPITLSHEISPMIREYRRAISSVHDAALKPVMSSFMESLSEKMRSHGFSGRIMSLTSMGGIWDVHRLASAPIYAVGSGPSVAPVGALATVSQDPELAAISDLIVCDTGGTTFDVSLVRDRATSLTKDVWLGRAGVGDLLGIEAVDIHSIGSGGGSIAGLNRGGLVTVGPQSAGSDPGPASYGQGGTEPTFTDAAVALGYIPDGALLGSDLKVSRRKAMEAIEERLASPLGITVNEAALAIFAISVEASVGAIREMTLAKGYSPAKAAIVSGGGASGLTITRIARALGCSTVVVPRYASTLSALGALYSDMIDEWAVAHFEESDRIDSGTLKVHLDSIAAQCSAFLDEVGGSALESEVSWLVEARYPRQVWELGVEFELAEVEDPEFGSILEGRFHDLHERIYGVSEPDSHLELVRWKTRGRAVMPKPSLKPTPGAGSVGDESQQKAVFPELGEVQVRRVSGGTAPVGTTIEGPSLVDWLNTVVVLNPGDAAKITEHGNLIVELESDSMGGG